MKKILLDGNLMKSKKDLFRLIKDKLNIDSFYGDNLDALWDVLSVYEEDLLIEMINTSSLLFYLGGYGNALISAFNDLSDENKHIKFNLKS